ncbi:hypothetical protein AMELA_G00257400, partial [Ameiurus melas]
FLGCRELPRRDLHIGLRLELCCLRCSPQKISGPAFTSGLRGVVQFPCSGKPQILRSLCWLHGAVQFLCSGKPQMFRPLCWLRGAVQFPCSGKPQMIRPLCLLRGIVQLPCSGKPQMFRPLCWLRCTAWFSGGGDGVKGAGGDVSRSSACSSLCSATMCLSRASSSLSCWLNSWNDADGGVAHGPARYCSFCCDLQGNELYKEVKKVSSQIQKWETSSKNQIYRTE